MITGNFAELREKYNSRLDELFSLRRDTSMPGWDMAEARAIPQETFNNAIILLGKLKYERMPEIQISTNGNLGLFFGKEIFAYQRMQVVTVGVIFRGGDIRIGTLFLDDSESSTGFRWCGIDEINKTAEYINGIGNNGQDRL